MKRHLEYPDRSVYDHFRKCALEYGSLSAIDYYGRSISYREVLREVNRCACALIAAGVEKGDSISICLPNIPQAVYLFYAVKVDKLQHYHRQKREQHHEYTEISPAFQHVLGA